jgi:hypothetical protein
VHIYGNFSRKNSKSNERLVITMTDNEKMDHENKAKKDHGNDNNDQGRDMVVIVINEIDVRIHRGHQTIAAIKVAGNIPSTDILYQMPNYEAPLDDNGSITIKGGERFKSCAPSGASS